MRMSLRFALVLPLLCGTLGAVEAIDMPVVQWREKPLAVSVAVSWELTRSDGGKEGVATNTEHYRETWFFEMRPGLDTFLVSPRGRVAVTGIGYGNREIPRRVVMAEGDLARLLGIPLIPLEEEESIAPLVSIEFLPERGGGGQSYTLPLSEQDYVGVQLELTL